jgi:DNA-binding GntR family transcriptional regulator
MRRPKSGIAKISRVGVTRHLQIYALLMQELAAGGFKPKEALPSEPALVNRYGVSRTTVRRALARLEREGKILRKRGSGTFVRRAKETTVRCPCCGQRIQRGSQLTRR